MSILPRKVGFLHTVSVSTNGRQSVEQSIHAIKKISRIWGDQTHRKIAMDPDLEFGTRKNIYLDSGVQGFC